MHEVIAERLAALLSLEAKHGIGRYSTRPLSVEAFIEERRRLTETLPAGPWDRANLIPDRDLLEVLDAYTALPLKEDGPRHMWATTWDIEFVFGVAGDTAQAALCSLLARGMIDGCACGCRGDWNLDSYGTVERPSVDDLMARHGRA